MDEETPIQRLIRKLQAIEDTGQMICVWTQYGYHDDDIVVREWTTNDGPNYLYLDSEDF